MRVIVLHHSLNRIGGAERVCISTIEALQSVGHNVVLATKEKTDRTMIYKAFGKRLKVKEISLLPFKSKFRTFGIYQRLLARVISYKFRKNADVVVNTCNVPYVGTDVTYLHFPTFAKPLIYGKYQKSLWKFYSSPYRIIDKILLEKYIKTTPIILTNSLYTASIIKKNFRREAVVVHPPVDTSTFFCPLTIPKFNVVLTVGRFAREKNIEFVAKIARLCKDEKFVIAGSTTSNHKESLEIIKNTKRQRLANLKIMVNVSLKKLRELYTKAKIYLHTMVGEHFGISLVEAMSAGCILVVHKSGGPWIDIVQKGKWGFGYETVEEAATHINRLMHEDNKLRALAQKRSTHFTEDKFKRRIVKIVESLNKDPDNK